MSDPNERRWAPALAALDANLLVALDALVHESNVTRAARRIGVTQSAMSQTLGRLRRQFDDPILVKVGRRMEPSPFALRIKGRLHAAIGGLEAVVRDRPTFDPHTSTQRFVLATVDYLALLIVPELRKLVAAEAPGVRLAIQALDPESVTGRLAQGTTHLYVGVRSQTERALETRVLYPERLVMLVRRGHPFAGAPPSLDAFADAEHVHVSPRREAGSIVGRGLAASGHDRKVALEVPFFALLPDILSNSDLVATVPARIGDLFAREFEFVVQPIPLELPGFEVCMAWHPTFAADPALVWFRDAVGRVASD